MFLLTRDDVQGLKLYTPVDRKQLFHIHVVILAPDVAILNPFQLGTV